MVPVSWSKDAAIKTRFLARQLPSPSMAPHCLKLWVAARPRFSTPRRGPLIRILSIQARIFSDRVAAFLKLTTAVSCANARITTCSISGLHLHPTGSPVSSTNPQVSVRHRKPARLPCGELALKKDAFMSNTPATSSKTAPR
ncbi:hypothetical protein TRVL_10353 [Trypanosoma vivax]|nr:hypothetical protein TRVL_10353 [Trypanosoma vivax]